MGPRLNRDRLGPKVNLGQFEAANPGRLGGVVSVQVRGWYLRKVGRLKYRVRLELGPDHHGRTVSFTEGTPWAGQPDRSLMQAHLRAISRKYQAKLSAGEWPTQKAWLALCNAGNKSNFIATTCAGCAASYCTVSR